MKVRAGAEPGIVATARRRRWRAGCRSRGARLQARGCWCGCGQRRAAATRPVGRAGTAPAEQAPRSRADPDPVARSRAPVARRGASWSISVAAGHAGVARAARSGRQLPSTSRTGSMSPSVLRETGSSPSSGEAPGGAGGEPLVCGPANKPVRDPSSCHPVSSSVPVLRPARATPRHWRPDRPHPAVAASGRSECREATKERIAAPEPWSPSPPDLRDLRGVGEYEVGGPSRGSRGATDQRPDRLSRCARRRGRVAARGHSAPPAARGAVGSLPSSPMCSRARKVSTSSMLPRARSTIFSSVDICATSSTCSLRNHCMNCSPM